MVLILVSCPYICVLPCVCGLMMFILNRPSAWRPQGNLDDEVAVINGMWCHCLVVLQHHRVHRSVFAVVFRSWLHTDEETIACQGLQLCSPHESLLHAKH